MNFEHVPPKGRMLKIRKKIAWFYWFLLSVSGILLWITPLGRVFKIRDIFMHDFVEFSTSIRGLIKWVTPLGVR